jgi:hypothetical protein
VQGQTQVHRITGPAVRPFLDDVPTHTRSVLHLSSPGPQRSRAFRLRHWVNPLISPGPFLMTFAVFFIALGVAAYYYAQWTLDWL